MLEVTMRDRGVCALKPSDIPAVANQFQRNFRDPRKPAPDSLKAYLADLFLHHYWHRSEEHTSELQSH